MLKAPRNSGLLSGLGAYGGMGQGSCSLGLSTEPCQPGLDPESVTLSGRGFQEAEIWGIRTIVSY